MLINEVCKECNLTKKAIEYYGEQGLVRPTATKNGYRHYSEADVAKLKKIAILRGLGLAVSDIREVLETDDHTALYGIVHRKELEISELQEKHALMQQLAQHHNWETTYSQLDALQKKQSILNRMLDQFPGSYGKFLCSHFAPFLGDPITTSEQQEAFDTIIAFWDNVEIEMPDDLRELLEETAKAIDTDILQSTSTALATAIENPEQYISDNKEWLERYQAVMASDEYKATPVYRLRELLKQLQKENGYNDLFIPAMKRLSPSYREYHDKLLVANEVFIQHYPPEK